MGLEMKKIKEKFRSVRVKLFTSLSAVIIFIIVLLIVMNSIVLETFYTLLKVNTVKKEFYKINDLYNKKDPTTYAQINNDAEINSFEILIKNESGIIVYSTSESFTNLIEQNKEITTRFKILEDGKQSLIYTQNNMVIQKISTSKVNCILLLGELDNEYKVYIQIQTSAIKESVRISDNLLLIIGMISIVIAGIAASFISKKFTAQILELNVIANKMAKLDFSQKYEPTEANDEIDELGNNINIMSDKLETTIKQLRKSNIELERDIEEKSKIDEMRKQFISDVSHELKTPIALIQGYAEGLVENISADEESRKYYAEVILDESNKMDKLVRQLLELMKLEYGKREFSNNKFNICELIEEVIRKCNVMLEERQITDVRFKESEQINVYADEFYIEQAFTNYFTNAIKNTREIDGSKYIEIKVTKKQNEDSVRISVFNTGENISEENLDRIWGRFYKVDESRNRADGGSGIGLSLVKAIMNNYNAEYGVLNKENGVEFYFDIQLSKD
ncbi:MAG: histidine kinase dimerization/phospho-acceptor domain-containing protein [Clostridia bacterium]